MANLCPKCRVELAHLRDGEGCALGLACAACGGVFLESAQVDELRAGRRIATFAAAAATADAMATASATGGPPLCVVCERLMHRHTTEVVDFGLAGVVLDACMDHGVWFDAQELRRIAKALGERRASVHAEVAAFGGGTNPLLELLGAIFRRRRGSRLLP